MIFMVILYTIALLNINYILKKVCNACDHSLLSVLIISKIVTERQNEWNIPSLQISMHFHHII